MNEFINTEELARLEALQKYKILDTDADPDFDNLVRLAVKIFNVSMSTVTIVDADRQWFKSAIGLDVKETARDISFCTHAISSKLDFTRFDRHIIMAKMDGINLHLT